MFERRKTGRFGVVEPVIVMLAQGNYVGELRDVSSSGMFIALRTVTTMPGTTIVVQICPAHPRPAVELSGVIRWTDHRGIGVELREIATTERDALALLIDPPHAGA